MPVVAVVRADEENRDLGGRDEVEFPVLQVPKDLLRAITIVAQIDGVTWRVVPFPDHF